MRRYSMSNKEGVAKILPRNGNDQKALWSIAGLIALIGVVFVTVLFFQHRRQQEMEYTWQRATATIEDVRPVAVLQVDSKYGGAMLYQVEILARYDANGSEQRRWIKIERKPGPRPEDSQMSRWKGKQFVVRWKASQPDQVVPELN
jgi:hypothetical protein